MDLLNLDDVYVRETRERIDQIVAHVLAIEGGDLDPVDALLGELHTLKGGSALVGYQDVSNLCHHLEDCLAETPTDDSTRVATVTQLLLDACDFIRLHTDAVADTEDLPPVPASLLVSPCSEQKPAEPDALTIERGSSDKDDQIDYEADGVVAGADGDAIRIGLPQVAAFADRDAVLKALADIYDRTPHKAKWIVDMSAFESLSALLLGSLLSHQQRLRQHGGTIELVGVRPELLPAEHMETLNRTFPIQHG